MPQVNFPVNQLVKGIRAFNSFELSYDYISKQSLQFYLGYSDKKYFFQHQILNKREDWRIQQDYSKNKVHTKELPRGG